jgi:protein-disulfide isomerase
MTQDPASATTYCPYCGSLLASGAGACPSCGRPIQPQGPVQPAAAWTPQGYAPGPAAGWGYPQAPAPRSSSGSIIIVVSVIAFAITALLVVLVGASALLFAAAYTRDSSAGAPNPSRMWPAPIAPAADVATPAAIPSNGRTLGNANANHTIDIWVDFQCPVCRDFNADAEPMLVANYISSGRVKLVFHDYIVIDAKTRGTESRDAANAALCANDQGQFWTYHDWLFANQYDEGSGAFSKARLKTIGQSSGIRDLTTFDSCVDGGTHNGDIIAEVAPPSVTGTPTIFVDGAPTTNYDYATVSAALDKAIGN